mmetsp:Transcript_23766/g.36670  ORF Transcript_23766/g.36670 Transcript_23766/m.36670 type:complete len:90 (+) Transcript_23766:832-1101(+)
MNSHQHQARAIDAFCGREMLMLARGSSLLAISVNISDKLVEDSTGLQFRHLSRHATTQHNTRHHRGLIFHKYLLYCLHLVVKSKSRLIG